MRQILLPVKNFWRNNKKTLLQLGLFYFGYKLIFLAANYYYLYYNIVSDVKTAHDFFGFYAQGDAHAYLQIARNGYSDLSLMAFYPLFPMLIAMVGHIMPVVGAAYAINFLALFVAIFGLYKLANLDLAKQAAQRAVFYLLIFPSAVFLNVDYTEAVFLALAVWIFYAARQGYWKTAAVLGYFSGLTRVDGVAVPFFLCCEYLEQLQFKWRQINWRIILTITPWLGLASYGLYLYVAKGDFWLFIKAQSVYYGRHLTWPWQPLLDTMKYMIIHAHGFVDSIFLIRFFDLAVFIAVLMAAPFIYFRLRKSYGIYTLVDLLLITFGAYLASTNRRALVFFPVYILLGKLTENNYVALLLNFLFILLFGLFLSRYGFGLWAG